jgi:ribosomal-protein-alanine N-acetyltransferase
MSNANGWYLRRATAQDADEIHALMCVPEVYRYLADGAAPPRSIVEQWIEHSEAQSSASGLGLWLLKRDATLGGCVLLEMRMEPRSAELTYLLHPQFWGKGLATRMSWAVIQRAFDSDSVDQVLAGADTPNTASLAVMRRLGMTYLRTVQYPAGPGVEYVYRRSASRSETPKVIPMMSS